MWAEELIGRAGQEIAANRLNIHESVRGELHGIDPAVTCFFEDSERNLAPAYDLGMTTVLVGPWAAQSTAAFVHHRTAKLAPFLMDARLKEAA